MDEYKDIMDMLKPRRDFAASDELRQRIKSTIDPCENRNHSARWIWLLGTSGVAAALLILILLPTRMSAKEILAETLNRFLSYNNIGLTIEVRTRPIENFKYIDFNEDFVAHDISVARADSSQLWRIDKGGRTAVCVNGTIYNWITDLKIGWKAPNQNPEEMLGELSVFLIPEKIIEAELRNCASNSDEYSIKKDGSDIILSVHARPKGNFSNPYMLNASITESENFRRYVIDSDTKRLKSASVSILDGVRSVEVLRITEINYGLTGGDIEALPKDVRFIDISQDSISGFSGLSATEAASVFLNALELWDVSILERAMDKNVLTTMYEHEFRGAALVSVGKSFVSGVENTTFVPYTLKLRDGSKKTHNLALRKGNKGGWIVVGGL